MFDAQTAVGAIGRGGIAALRLKGFRMERVASDIVLATYIARTAPGAGWRPPSLRSSLVPTREPLWQIVFHQGTRVPADAVSEKE